MNNTTSSPTADEPTPPAPASAPPAATVVHAPTPRTARGGEKTAWWITFGVILFAIVTMLSLWN